MALFEDQIIPYLGPGFCSKVSCKFFHYEPFHKPIQGCSSFHFFKNLEPSTLIFDPKFNLKFFMDFASNERWRCYNKQCQISWSEPFHCQGDSRCISYEKFCLHFSIPYKEISNFQTTKQFQYCGRDSYRLDLPHLLTEDSGDENASELENEDDTGIFFNPVVNRFYDTSSQSNTQAVSEPNKLPKCKISEAKQANQTMTYQSQTAGRNVFDPKTAKNHSNSESFCCKCHSQGAKCINC